MHFAFAKLKLFLARILLIWEGVSAHDSWSLVDCLLWWCLLLTKKWTSHNACPPQPECLCVCGHASCELVTALVHMCFSKLSFVGASGWARYRAGPKSLLKKIQPIRNAGCWCVVVVPIRERLMTDKGILNKWWKIFAGVAEESELWWVGIIYSASQFFPWRRSGSRAYHSSTFKNLSMQLNFVLFFQAIIYQININSMSYNVLSNKC